MTRAWLTILACGIGVSMSISPAFLTVSGLYLVPMTRELGWTRTDFSLGISLVSLVAVLLTPFVGGLIDRVGARPLAIAAALALPLGLFAQSLLGPSHLVFLGVSALMGIVAAIASPLTFVSVVPQWVEQRLGLAIALSLTGLGIGQVCWSFATPRLIETLGWRVSWRAAAVVLLLVALTNALLLFRERPDYVSARRAPAGTALLEGYGFGEAMRTPTFCLASVAVMLVSMVTAGLALHIAPLLIDRGLPLAKGAAALTFIALGSLGGRLVTGFLLDRIRFGIVGAVLFAGQAAGLLLLLTDGAAGMQFYIATFLAGLAIGAESDLIPFLIRRCFGMRAYGALFGMMFALYQVGPVIGPWLMSRAYDRTGSYAPTLLAFAGAAMLAAVLIALADAARPGPPPSAGARPRTAHPSETPVRMFP